EIGAPARVVGDSGKQFLGLFAGPPAEKALLLGFIVDEADQINLDFVFLNRVHYFFFFDRAVLLQTVSDHDQGFAAALAFFLRVVGGGDDCVEQGRAAARIQFAERVFEFAPVGGEILHQ